VVGWLDAFAKNSRLGRSEIHAATYQNESEAPDGKATLSVEAQNLPLPLFGLPRAEVWRLMRPFASDRAMACVNSAKFHLARMRHNRTYQQSHAAFAFLLDYIPDWRLAYGDGGFVQHQLFVPHANAHRCLERVLQTCQEAEHVPYLAVLKRHQSDAFLLSHALDGWSLALDFRITERSRSAIWSLLKRLTLQVLEAGGKFYFAKDAVLTAEDVARAYGHERVNRFLDLKRKLDPSGLFGSDLAERVFTTHLP
jgi:FAD/FMN-containing dehydrogenase